MCLFSILVGLISFLLWLFGAVSGEGAFIGYFIVAGIVQTSVALSFIVETNSILKKLTPEEKREFIQFSNMDFTQSAAAEGAKHYIFVGPIQIILALILILT